MGKVVSLGSVHSGSSRFPSPTRAPVRKFFNLPLLVEKIRKGALKVRVYFMQQKVWQKEFRAERLELNGDAASLSRAVKLLDEAIPLREKMLFLMNKLRSPRLETEEEDLHEYVAIRNKLREKLAGLPK